MSSATSTEQVRLKPDTTPEGRSRLQSDELQPWQFFVLAALGCATAVTFFARGRGLTSVILLSVLMGTAALIGLAALRALRPLVSPHDDRTLMIGLRTRVALEREKMLTLRAIKELEFDRAMGKLSDADWQEMSGRLRARAAGLIRQLDAGSGYREQIERDLAKRLAQGPAEAGPHVPAAGQNVGRVLSDPPVCAGCATANDPDARFCKSCGSKL
ncbi:MAG: zinc ribbon domain-containing protein [Vicinamibacterales bacterium]